MAQAGLYALLGALVLASFVVPPPERSLARPSGRDELGQRALPLARAMTRLHDVEDLAPAGLASAEADSIAELIVGAASGEVVAEAAVPIEPGASPSREAAPVEDDARANDQDVPAQPDATRVEAPPSPIAAAAAPEARMLALINASRVAAGLSALAADDRVATVARAHSAAEADARYVYHDGPDGTAHSRDVAACASGWFGENTGKIWNDNVTALHAEFMAEPWEPINHRTNIMDPSFRRIGIGAVIGRDALYMTMVFCR